MKLQACIDLFLSQQPHTPKPTDKSLSGRKSQLEEEGVSSAGYTYIRKYLEESEKIIVAERGGQTFEKCVKELEVGGRSMDSQRNDCAPLTLLL